MSSLLGMGEKEGWEMGVYWWVVGGGGWWACFVGGAGSRGGKVTSGRRTVDRLMR